jgi:hypothetical protein
LAALAALLKFLLLAGEAQQEETQFPLVVVVREAIFTDHRYILRQEL